MFEHSVIKRIEQHDVLNVGVSLGFKGLSQRDPLHNQWNGFDIDLARAVAIAVLGDAGKIHFVPLQSADRFQALRDGVIDLGTFNASVTFQREAEFGIHFLHPMLFDGEVLMTSLSNLTEEAPQARFTRQRRIAAMRGSTTEENLTRYFDALELPCEILLFNSPQQARQAYESGECDIYCLDGYLLAGEHQQLTDSTQHLILDDRISLEAMAPAVSAADPQWYIATKWIMRALIEAENLGITQNNIIEKSNNAEGYLKTFLYPDVNLCSQLGLQPDFIRQIIRKVGNYSEIFERNLGNKSELKQHRRDNKPWAEGGMLWSPLFI
ncbi:amino acid ABC transporter substrate-binding protein [Pantoea allii]|uniref:Polar amino acid transport system substrate-binding protein n=1 Tax=Pantoea allii TaxID=574096 RepID=A0A2V2BJI4_9GAMM|nr:MULTISPECIES: amino acid ABC transporter substrate-binding protein [Pantoea]MCH9299471.1 amino acid ABC transporter substrate-binding protein [Pantoea allii]PWK95373.1 polar amino acid transport system substrate-binding protein [Pantoea allii]TWD36093.1 polar amino acid transport system substrate-binding protein [Pantoea sp. SJZ147]